MAKKPETLIVESIIKQLKKTRQFDGFHVHGNMMQRGGEPDLDGSVWSKVGWLHLKLEVKTKTGEPTLRQMERVRRYHKREYVAGIVTSALEAEQLICAYEQYYEACAYGIYPPTFSDYLLKVGLNDTYSLY